MLQTIVLALHVIGSGLMIGVVFFVFGTVAAIWQTVTGLILYFGEGDEFKDSKIFWIKIGLFILDGIIALLIIDRRIKTIESKSKGEVNLQNTFLWNLLSVLIVISIITLGVFLTEG